MPSTLSTSSLSLQNGSLLQSRPVRSDLRIVIVSDALRHRNGVGTYYQDLVDHLQDRVACARLFCPDSERGGFRRLAIPLPGDRTQQLRLPAYRSLARAIRELRPDVIVVPTPGPYGWCGTRIAKRLDIPLCAGHHTRLGELVRMYWHNPLGRLAGHYLQELGGYVFRRSGLVLGNSQEMVESARAAGAADVRLVGTPLARCFLDSPPPEVPSEVRSVLYVGRLAFEKNLEAVVEAAEQLPDIEFCIAGDGPQRHYVQKAASRLENLRYAGWVAREQVVSLLDAHTMLVLPSRIESFGTAAMEAMARRRLVLVSAECGILDWQPLRDAIFRIAPDETLAAAINRVRQLRADRRREKAALGHRAVQTLNEETLAEWIRLLEELKQRHSGAK